MQKKQGFIAYDWFKLIIAILLVVTIFILWVRLSASTSATEIPAAETEEIVATKPDLEPTEEPEVVEETETVEEETASLAEMELPPLPEPNTGLEYDAAKGWPITADGELIYPLNEDGSGWTPVIPDDLKTLIREGEWTLLGADGLSANTWVAESPINNPNYFLGSVE